MPFTYSPEALSPGETGLNRTIVQDERDLFAFNASRGMQVNITIRWADPSDDIDIFLISPRDFVVGRSSSSGTIEEQILTELPDTGRYLLVVSGYRMRTAPVVAYTLLSSIPLEHFVTAFRVRVDILGLNDLSPTNVTFTSLGVVHKEKVSGPFTLDVDNGTTIALVPTITISSVERFRTADRSSWVITRPSFFNVTYFDQFRPRLTLEGLKPEFPVRVVEMVNGRERETRSAGEWSEWVDSGSFVTLDRTVQGTPSLRFRTEDAVRWRADTPFEGRVQYYQQWKVSISVRDVPYANPVGVTYGQNGQSFTQYVHAETWSDWVDHGTAISLTRQALGSTDRERWGTETTDFPVQRSESYTIAYMHQYWVTMVVEGLADAQTPLLNITQFNNMRQVPVTGQWGGWVDAATEVSLPPTLADGHGTRWLAQKSTSELVQGAVTLNVVYTPEYRVSLAFTTSEDRMLPPPLPSRVLLVGPEGDMTGVTSYEALWLPAGVWRVAEVVWHGANIAPSLPAVFTPTPGGTWTIGTGVHDLQVVATDFAGIPVVGADLLFNYPDGNAYRIVTDDRGYAVLPAVFPGASLIRVSHLGLSTIAEGDFSQSDTLSLKAPPSTPSLVIASLILIVAIVSVGLAVRGSPVWRRTRQGKRHLA